MRLFLTQHAYIAALAVLGSIVETTLMIIKEVT